MGPSLQILLTNQERKRKVFTHVSFSNRLSKHKHLIVESFEDYVSPSCSSNSSSSVLGMTQDCFYVAKKYALSSYGA